MHLNPKFHIIKNTREFKNVHVLIFCIAFLLGFFFFRIFTTDIRSTVNR